MTRHDPDIEVIEEAEVEFPELRLSVGTTFNLVGRVVSVGASFLIGIVVARALGTAGKGELSVVMQVVSLLAVVVSLGIGSANVFFVSHGKVAPGVAVGNSLVFGALGALIGLPFILVLLRGPFAVVPGVTWTTVVLAALLLPIMLLTGWLQGVTGGLGRIGLSAWLSFVSAALTFVGVAALWWRGMLGVSGVVAVSLVGSVIGLLVLVIGAWRALAPIGADASAARSMVRYSARIYAGELAGYLVERQDTLLVGWLAGASAVGLYSVGVSFAELLWFLPSALGPVIFSKGARTSATSAADYVARSCRVSVVIMVATSLALIVVVPLAVPILYKPSFAPASFAFYALLPGILCDGVGRLLASFLNSRDVILWRASLIAVGANIVLNIVLIPAWGIVGAGLASSICYGGLAVAALRAFHAETGMGVGAVVVPTTEDVRVLVEAIAGLPGRLLGRG